MKSRGQEQTIRDGHPVRQIRGVLELESGLPVQVFASDKCRDGKSYKYEIAFEDKKWSASEYLWFFKEGNIRRMKLGKKPEGFLLTDKILLAIVEDRLKEEFTHNGNARVGEATLFVMLASRALNAARASAKTGATRGRKRNLRRTHQRKHERRSTSRPNQ